MDETLADLIRKNHRLNGRAIHKTPDSPPVVAMPWPQPVALGEMPDAPCFPVDALPSALRRVVREAADAFACPLDFVGVPLLSLAGGAIGNARHLSIKRTHTQPPMIWSAIVGRPGTAKTPPLKFLARPFETEEGRRLEEWRSTFATWEGQDRENRGARPTPSRCLVSDITTESLGVALVENRRGLVMVRDELAGLVSGMNQYKGGRGHDRQIYLQLWSGSSIQIDRKSDTRGPLHVPLPCLSITGSIQPDILPRLRGEPVRGDQPPDDGFIDRFLIVYPPDRPAAGESWAEVKETTQLAWGSVVSNLLGLQMVASQDGSGMRPYYVHLAGCGQNAWETFTHRHAAEINDEAFPGHLLGPWAKLHGYVARLSLVLHCLGWACGEVENDQADVSGETVASAEVLADYFKGHLRRVYSCMDPDRRLAPARRIWEWICREKRATFKRWEAFGDLKSERQFPSPDSLDVPLGLLAHHNLIRCVETERRGGPGRPADPVWEVNPIALEKHPGNPVNPVNGGSNGNSRDLQDFQDDPQEDEGGSPWTPFDQ